MLQKASWQQKQKNKVKIKEACGVDSKGERK